MKYEVEGDWLLTTACNFNCYYCLVTGDSQTKVKIHGTSSEWKEGFDKTGKVWLIHITGGEPTLYPEFIDLCQGLLETHYVSLNTNLSLNSIEDFSRQVNPERVYFVNVAFHFRKWVDNFEVFVSRVKLLRKSGFTVMVTVVMSPAAIPRYPHFVEQFKPHGIFPLPKVMRGVCNGKRYPNTYSMRERAFVAKYLEEALPHHYKLVEEIGEVPSINILTDRHCLDFGNDFSNIPCSAGSRFIRVLPNGDLRRCRTEEEFGNLLKGTARLLDGPRPCDSLYCPYFCRKYTSIGV